MASEMSFFNTVGVSAHNKSGIISMAKQFWIILVYSCVSRPYLSRLHTKPLPKNAET